MKHNIKMRHVLGDLLKSVVPFLNMQFQFLQSWLSSSTSKSVSLQCLQMAKLLIGFCRELVTLFCSNYWQNSPITAAVHYFHYKSHKMHLYCLKLLLTILLGDMMPHLFQLHFVFFLLGYIFLQSYSKLFAFYAQ